MENGICLFPSHHLKKNTINKNNKIVIIVTVAIIIIITAKTIIIIVIHAYNLIPLEKELMVVMIYITSELVSSAQCLKQF